jgi:hypothetical protein
MKKAEIAYEKYINLIISDRVFQEFFFKRLNHKKYEDFKITNEKEKVKFLIDFYFYVYILLSRLILFLLSRTIIKKGMLILLIERLTVEKRIDKLPRTFTRQPPNWIGKLSRN